MADAVDFRIGGDATQAIAELKKIVRTQEDLVRVMREGGKQGRKAGQDTALGFGKARTAVMAVAGGMLGTGGVIQALGAGKRLINEWLAGLDQLAPKMKTAAQEALALAMLAEKGKARETVQLATAMGARFGVTDRAGALDVYQSALAQFDALGEEYAREALKLAGWAGVPIEAAKGAVSTAGGFGIRPAVAGRLPYAAGEVSAQSPAELAKISPALSAYTTALGGPGVAYGFAAALSPVFKEQLTTYTRALGLALSAPANKGAWGAFVSKQPGYASGDYLKILEGLKEQGLTTPKALGEVGLLEVRQAGALSAVLANLPATKRAVSETARLAATPGLIAQRRAGAEIGFPELQHQRKMALMEALAQAELVQPAFPAAIGTGRKAMEREAIQRERGLAMIRAGYAPMVGEDLRVGRPKWAYMWLWDQLRANPNPWPGEQRYQPVLRRELGMAGEDPLMRATNASRPDGFGAGDPSVSGMNAVASQDASEKLINAVEANTGELQEIRNILTAPSPMSEEASR